MSKIIAATPGWYLSRRFFEDASESIDNGRNTIEFAVIAWEAKNDLYLPVIINHDSVSQTVVLSPNESLIYSPHEVPCNLCYGLDLLRTVNADTSGNVAAESHTQTAEAPFDFNGKYVSRREVCEILSEHPLASVQWLRNKYELNCGVLGNNYVFLRSDVEKAKLKFR